MLYCVSGERQNDLAPFHADRIGPDGILPVSRCARLQVELPAVKRADHLSVSDNPVGQRAAPVRTGVLRSEELSVPLAVDGDGAAVDDVGKALTWGDRINRAKRYDDLQGGAFRVHTSPPQFYKSGSAELGRMYRLIRFGPGICAGLDRLFDLGI